MLDDVEDLLRRLCGGDHSAAAQILQRAGDSTSPRLLVAAAILSDAPHDLLSRAARYASTTTDRQLLAIAVTEVNGDEDLLDALVRDHLADYPDNILAAWICARHATSGHPAPLPTRSSHA